MQNGKAVLPRIANGFAIVTSCATADERGGNIHVDVFVSKSKRASVNAPYADSAYSLSIDNSIDFDGGKSQGLGVSTGAGRDGDGMHYWKISKNGRLIQDLGDAPRLRNDKFMKGYLSGLVSSGGEYQSFRYFYQVDHGRLVVKRAMGFNSTDSSSVNVTSMSVRNGQDFITERKTVLTEERAQQCQNGDINCW
ncbi:hypothetical protein [Caballeronia catudaia]|nr:hypothetical protein [Caballeronia catudaia]